MESTRRPSNQDQGQLASSSAQAQASASASRQMSGSPGHPSNHPPETAVVLRNQAGYPPGRPQKATRITLASLPPAPAPQGLKRVFATIFGPLRPLRFFWSIARRLWLIGGLLVIGAAVLNYLIDLFIGNVPTITEVFFTSPVLAIPARHPLRFMAGAGVVLLITILAWGGSREQQRRLNARAERVRRAITMGMTTDYIDAEMRAALLAGYIDANFQLATEIHEQDRIPDAIWLYQLILEQSPKHFGANYNLGLIHAETEAFDVAEGFCRTAILLNAESAEAQGLTAYVLYKLDLLEEAQRRARLAVRMGFSSQMLESLILPGLGVTSSMPAASTSTDSW
jgi:hypothetical protein